MTMYQDTYYVPKSTGTLTDALLAYGVATVLHALLQRTPGRRRNALVRVQIEDRGACYTICLPEAIREEWLMDVVLPGDLVRPILRVAKPKDETKAKPPKKPLPENLSAIDYNAIWDGIRKANALVEAQRQQGHLKREEIAELRASFQTEPRDQDVALLIGDYRMQVEGIHNQAVVQWHTTTQAGHQAVNLRAILEMFSTPHSDVSKVAKAWAKAVKIDGVKPRLTASQVYNPSTGKGQNKPKADQLAMGNEDYFWLSEYLKAVGLFAAAAPRAFTDEGMRKTYVLAPANIELNEHDKIFSAFKRTLDGAGVSPIKADVLTALDYANAYLDRYRAAKVEDPELDLDPNPRNTIKGFYVATYVLLSQNSFTMINLAFLGLPPWLNDINTRDDVDAVKEVIEEHRAIIRPLKEKFQEENILLDTYRDFLAGKPNSFFRFCSDYGEFVVRKLADPQNRYIRQHSIAALDQIIRRIKMPNVDPEDFISTANRYPGFHSIAYAIRHSTVIPQRQLARAKAQEPGAEKPLYDVRYGLGNTLRRKTDNVNEFMSALMEFVQVYSAETTQVYESTSEDRRRNPTFGEKRYRKQISITDLDDVLALIKKYDNDVTLVCNMLLAYGYATKRGQSQGMPTSVDGADADDVDNQVSSNEEEA